MENDKIELINKIVWYIPFKNLRDKIRILLFNILEINNNLNNLNYKIDKLLKLNSLNAMAQHINNEAFLKFKNINYNKDVVLISSDESINNYINIENAIYVGINDSINNNNIKLDYYFCSKLEDIPKKYYECKIFYGLYDENTKDNFDNKKYYNIENVIKYIIGNPYIKNNFVYDISSLPIPNFGDIIFTAIQFIFWTNPKTIYIAGYDIKKYLNFEVENNISLYRDTINLWRSLEIFRNNFYPNTNIISINPVGLSNIFKDIYNVNNKYIDNPSVEYYKKYFDKLEYINSFLFNNAGERMDANREDIFLKSRREFHIDRYLFASKYVKDKIVIDSASGTGYGANILYNIGKAKKVYGVEINNKAVAYSQIKYENENIIYKQGSILELPFDNETFDVFTSFETVEHVEQDEKQMQEVKRVLKNGGYYILSTPNSWGFTKFHVKDYNYFSIKELVSKYFKIEKIYNQNSDKPTTKRQIIETTESNYKGSRMFYYSC